MKVVFTGASLSRRGSGVSAVMLKLAEELSVRHHHDVYVLGVKDEYTMVDMSKQETTYKWRAFQSFGPPSFSYAPAMKQELFNINIDLIHVHGLWTYASLATLKWSQMKRQPYVISPHGMLDPWAVRNSAWKKRIAKFLYEKSHLAGASCIHALNDREAEAIRAYGLKNPICIVPNGIDLVLSTSKNEPRWRNTLPGSAKVLLYLGRLHPKKGLVNLLKSWAKLQESNRKGIEPWHLVIAGWDQGGHENELLELSRNLGISRTTHFPGSQFGEEKHATYRTADAFILPSLSEGLPMVVLEAWAYSKPVLMTEECNLTEGFLSGAAFRLGANVDKISSALNNFFEMSDHERADAGQKGRRLVEKSYDWSSIAKKMTSVYKLSLNGELKGNDAIKL